MEGQLRRTGRKITKRDGAGQAAQRMSWQVASVGIGFHLHGAFWVVAWDHASELSLPRAGDWGGDTPTLAGHWPRAPLAGVGGVSVSVIHCQHFLGFLGTSERPGRAADATVRSPAQGTGQQGLERQSGC